jgi:hypothetical protein
MAVARIVTFFLLAALAAGCALSEDSEEHEAGTAVKDVLEQEYFGQYGEAWDSLHPRHQRFVTRPDYEECRRGIDVAGTLESVLILDVRDEPLTVYGLRPQTPSKAVKVRVTTDESEFTASYHVIRVGDGWRWVLTDGAARGFARTDCPA